MITAA